MIFIASLATLVTRQLVTLPTPPPATYTLLTTVAYIAMH